MNSADQFEVIVGEHYEPLFRFAMSLTRAESDARDLTQQTFYVWATKGHQLRDISKVKTWLFTTLHRAFLKARQRQIRFPHHDLADVADQLPAFSSEVADRADGSQVLSALGQVDEIFRGAVALFYLEDCSYRDIAAILEVPVGTVKSRIARGVEQLREMLLADDSCGSSPCKDGILAVPVTGKSAVRLGNISSDPGRPAQLEAGVPEPDFDEWDFSSTLLGEPLEAF
jgi:RNA polymerase sigma-70 factor, ECF subfamily